LQSVDDTQSFGDLAEIRRRDDIDVIPRAATAADVNLHHFRCGIVISESEESYTLHLRNYAKHGRLVEDLADDLGVDLGEHRRLTWVRVSPKKASCKVQASNPVLMSCSETTKVTFLSGWKVESLQEIGSAEGEVSFSIDEGNFKSLNGFSSEGDFSIASLSVTNHQAYDSRVHVKILSDYCKPPFVSKK
jgi:hypothetical protein